MSAAERAGPVESGPVESDPVVSRPVDPVIPPTPLRTFLAMARRNGSIPPRRWPRLALYIARHLSFAPLRALEGALHNRAICRQRFAAPRRQQGKRNAAIRGRSIQVPCRPIGASINRSTLPKHLTLPSKQDC